MNEQPLYFALNIDLLSIHHNLTILKIILKCS